MRSRAEASAAGRVGGGAAAEPLTLPSPQRGEGSHYSPLPGGERVRHRGAPRPIRRVAAGLRRFARLSGADADHALPAKTLDFSPVAHELPLTRPAFLKETAELAGIARTLGPADLKRLMGISDKLAELNVQRFHAFKRAGRAQGIPAALAFAGDVYAGLKARELDGAALDWAQDRVRILSGLYGLLRPLDVIQPYRLEMGIRLANPRGADLYAFWRAEVTRALRKAAKSHADPTLVNLASQEYFAAVDLKALKLPVVACAFKEEAPDGGLRMIALFAKRARGAMARFAIDHRLERAEELKAFDRDGYRFAPEASDETVWTFTRPARQAAHP